jgi:hypothetical protein
MARFDQLVWDNSFAHLGDRFSERVCPTPLPAPRLVTINPDAAALLDLDTSPATSMALIAAANGEMIPSQATPLASLYAGHQFGVWVPQLGDGRAILLGEVVNQRHERWDVQVKGSGVTRYSRMGDGRAVLRSTIREYLACEAMHGLGVPTTRALLIATSDAPVYREQTETAALLIRLAPSHIRFGHFEVFASRSDTDALRRLADYVIEMHFAPLLTLPLAQRYAAWYREVVDRTARLVAMWTATGFAHGVLNTDNMSIVGITLDFGPYGWLDEYQRDFICNHSDPDGRYAFDQQPRVGLWNCARLGEALHTLVPAPDALAALESYRMTFEGEMDRLMRSKLGLAISEPEDIGLTAAVLGLLHDARVDYTRFFRALSTWSPGDAAARALLHAEVADGARLDAWLAAYAQRLRRESSRDVERHQRMLRANPRYVLRNWMAQDAIVNAQAGNYQLIEELRQLLATPFDGRPGSERYAERPPAWAREIAVSCSS